MPVVPFSEPHMSKPILDTADQKQNAFETFLAVLHAFEFLTWLFGPSIKILRALKSGAPLFMWLFKTIPFLIPILIIRYCLSWGMPLYIHLVPCS